jgi:predicted transcriptional regulator
MTIRKERVLELVRELPDDVDLDDLIDRLYLCQKLAAAEADVAAGRGLSVEEVRRAAATWRRRRIEQGIAQDDAGETVSQEEAERRIAKWFR